MIVCMSRRICVDLCRELTRLKPDWHADKGRIKVGMTGSASDPTGWQPHIRNKARREALAIRFRDADDPLQVVLVLDMCLTGLDAGGLVVDYIGLSHQLKQAHATYTESGGTGCTEVDKGEAIALMTEKYEVCLAMEAWVSAGQGGAGDAGGVGAGGGVVG